ncbi:hypothetical protein CCAND38_30016 [Capnocytophaga canis]|uniref:Uncharacterized protein n=1 Tax=Capnocytophaga canis TaxID=1848903 RepID=A0A0B7I6Z4_9FLAO|nr:hypothetical protein CCAND38_30016 [Capnocytophaga canis]
MIENRFGGRYGMRYDTKSHSTKNTLVKKSIFSKKFSFLYISVFYKHPTKIPKYL